MTTKKNETVQEETVQEETVQEETVQEETAQKETVQEETAQEETAQKETVQEETAQEERVEVFIPRGPANDEPNLFVSVNGVGYLLPKGKKSMVPPHIKAEIERSLAAQEKLDEHVDALLKEANAPLPGATV